MMLKVGAVMPIAADGGRATPLGDGIRGYADAGVGHLVCAVTAANPESMKRLSEASRRARE
ncbi:MAG: hypothetical protein ABI622_02500 [Chloroflexota bacterium]